MIRISLLVALLAGAGSSAVAAEGVKLTDQGNQIRVEVDGKFFTNYIYDGYPKPILYPVIGPDGESMTRNYPMNKEVKGEAHDHPHHMSVWVGHRSINGHDFWSVGSKSGKIVHRKMLCLTSGSDLGEIQTENDWVSREGEIICSDQRTVRFHRSGDARVFDYEITLRASHGDINLHDDKDALMAIRTNPNLRLKNDPKHGVNEVHGHALNSAGDRDRELWGKAAKWLDYWGPIDGRVVGVAIFDHPQNLRHPTTWHARDYGLIAANPFGLSYFQSKPAGTGNFAMKNGQTQTFRYRFVFHRGDAEQARIDERYEEYARE